MLNQYFGNLALWSISLPPGSQQYELPILPVSIMQAGATITDWTFALVRRVAWRMIAMSKIVSPVQAIIRAIYRPGVDGPLPETTRPPPPVAAINLTLNSGVTTHVVGTICVSRI